jgi:hypothetical protein
MGKSTPPFPLYPEWTTARFWSFLRSALRNASQRWGPKQEVKKHNRRPYDGNNVRQKWEYRCESCGGWFMDKEVEVNHKIPVGELSAYEDLPEFVRRLFCGVDGFEIVCKTCHNQITAKWKTEKGTRSNKN